MSLIMRLFYILAIYTIGINAINRDGNTAGNTVKASAANITAYNSPYAYYDYERDPRQWMSGGYGAYAPMYGFSGSFEAIAIGLIIALAVGAIGFPLLLLLFTIFNGNSGSGFNFVPPSTTTTVTGRKKRDTASILFPSLNPLLREKVFDIFEKFTKATDKMAYLKQLVDS